WSPATCWRPGVQRGGKQERMPAELRRYAGVGGSDGGTLAAVLLPGRDQPATGALDDPRRARRALERNCYSPVDPVWPEDWLGIGGPNSSPVDVDAVVGTLLSDVPLIACRIGARPLPELTRQLAEAVGTAQRVSRPAAG